MVKKLFTLTASALLALSLFAQTPIPNGGFETWSNGNPTGGWTTSDALLVQFAQPDPGSAEKDTAAANVYEGTASARLTCKLISVFGMSQVIPGAVVLGKLGIDLSTFTPQISGVAYTDRPDSLIFAAKYTKAVGSQDSGAVILTLTSWDHQMNQRIIVANVIVPVGDLANFQEFKTKIQYHSLATPDTLLLQGVSVLSQNGTDGSTMWLDGLQVVGTDTAFKAYISPFFVQPLCVGDTLPLHTDNLQGDTYQWFNAGVPINGATTPQLPATTDGAYYVQVTHNGTVYTSDTLPLVFNAVPVVDLTLSFDTICRNASAVTLSGGTPTGGTYDIDGTTATSYDPQAFTNGPHDVTYTYTNNNGCSAAASSSTVIVTCTGINAVDNSVKVNLYPNPASSVITVETDQNLTGGTIQIYDLQGRMVMQQAISSNKQNLNLARLSNGNYTVSVFTAAKKLATNAQINVAH